MNNKRIAIIPFLTLVYFFIHYTTDLFYFLNPELSVKQFFKYILITGLLYFSGDVLFKNKERFTLIFSTLLFLFLFFGTILDTYTSITHSKNISGIDLKISLGFIVLCTGIILLFNRANQQTIKLLLTCWQVFILLVIIYDAGLFFISDKKEKKYLNTFKNFSSLRAGEKPSVFFLLFDMYPSDSVCKKYLHFDNTDLNAFLKQKDFFVTGNAHALYEETYYSLGSTLSLKPLDYLNDNRIQDYKKKLIALKNIEYSTVPVSFERSGYIFRNYSVFNLRGKTSPLQFNLNYHLENALTASTFYNRLYESIEPDFILANRNIDIRFLKSSWSQKVKKDLFTLNNEFNLLMDNYPKTNKPSFNYFHFMMPHPPLIYDSSGKENSVKDMYGYNGFDKTIANYTGFIKYTNNELKRMVNKIFAQAGKNVIIIIQGDHGYRGYSERFPDELRSGILNAVYLPGKNYTNFNDSISPIQTFQLVFKNQFGLNNGTH